MKKIICIVCVNMVLWSCQEKMLGDTMELSVNIKGLKKGTIYIQKVTDSALVNIDTIRINGNSDFVTNLEIKSPEMFFLVLDRGVTVSGDNSLSFFAEARQIKINTSLDNFSLDAKISGSKNQDLYNEYRKVATRFVDKNLDLIELKLKAVQSKNNAEYEKINSEQVELLKRKYLYTTNFAINNGNYEVAPYVTLAEIPDINVKYLDTIQKRMSPKVAQSVYGKKIIQLIKDRKLK